jgi:capsular exopolysaccharide synthesis family protein
MMEQVEPDFDINKFLRISRTSFKWIVLIFISCLFIAWLFIRYTKPVFMSSMVLKLEINNHSNSLGLMKNMQDENNENSQIAGEIELIKSSNIRDKVFDLLKLNVRYFAYGNIINEEKYKNAPIELDTFAFEGTVFYQRPIDVHIENDEFFTLSMPDFYIDKMRCKFNTLCEFNGLVFKINKTRFFNNDWYDKKLFVQIISRENFDLEFTENFAVDISNREANTIILSYKDYSSLKAYDMLLAIDSIYHNQSVEFQIKTFDQALDFLSENINKTEENLIKAQSDFEKFMKQSKTMDAKGDFSRITSLLDDLEKNKTILRNQLELLNRLQNLIRKEQEVTDLLPAIEEIGDAQLSEIIGVLNTQIIEYKKLKLSHSENTFAVKNKKESIDKLQVDVLNLIGQDVKSINIKLQQTNSKSEELINTQLSLPSKETEMTRLQRNYNLYDKFYMMLMDKYVEQSISKAGITNKYFIVKKPEVVKTPHYPNKKTVYLSAIGISILLGITLIIIRFLLSTTIISVKELDAIKNVTILGSLPEFMFDKNSYSKLLVHKHKRSSLSEAMRTIRTNLDFIIPTGRLKTISITSTISGEGKTFVATNLAGILAMTDKKVLVLDLDMRKPKVHLAFDGINEEGMSTLLIGKSKLENVIQTTEITNLHFISAGPIPPNPSELLLSKTFEDLIDKLKEEFDIIVLDTPPIGLVTDGMLLMKKVDLPIFVVRINYSQESVKKFIKETIDRGSFKHFSIIANAEPIKMRIGYGYGYGYYVNDKKSDLTWYKRLINRF